MIYDFKFPDGFDRLSFWQIACRITGQNTLDEIPSNDTQDVLSILAKLIALDPPSNLWVTFDTVADGTKGHAAFLNSFKTKYGRDDVNWGQYKTMFVRRDDWESFSLEHRWNRLLPDANHQYLMGTPDDLGPWSMADTWDSDTACQLITLGCKLDMSKKRLAAKYPVVAPEFDSVMARSICDVYDRAMVLAMASINGGNLNEHDTPENWLKWGASKGYSVSHLHAGQTAARGHAPSYDAPPPAAPTNNRDPSHMSSEEDDLSVYFDGVGTEQLETMFPSEGKWASWANHAGENGLAETRTAPGKFNPYKAGRWWMDRKRPRAWDEARFLRVLGKNLPRRSVDKKDWFE